MVVVDGVTCTRVRQRLAAAVQNNAALRQELGSLQQQTRRAEARVEKLERQLFARGVIKDLRRRKSAQAKKHGLSLQPMAMRICDSLRALSSRLEQCGLGQTIAEATATLAAYSATVDEDTLLHAAVEAYAVAEVQSLGPSPSPSPKKEVAARARITHGWSQQNPEAVARKLLALIGEDKEQLCGILSDAWLWPATPVFEVANTALAYSTHGDTGRDLIYIFLLPPSY